jgi:NDP-sugar pyrophosphorylase family protein
MADRPKVLAPIGGRPFLAYLLDQLEMAGWRQVILCTGYLAEMIRNEFGSTYQSLSLAYSVEDEPLGTAGALRQALAQTNSDLCLAMNGDSYVATDLTAFLSWHNHHTFAGSLLLTRVEDSARYGTVEVAEDGTIRTFYEKQGKSVAGWINAGLYLLARHLLESVPVGKAVSIEHDCFPQWAALGLGAYQTESPFIDIGTPESFASAESFLSGWHTQ